MYFADVEKNLGHIWVNHFVFVICSVSFVKWTMVHRGQAERLNYVFLTSDCYSEWTCRSSAAWSHEKKEKRLPLSEPAAIHGFILVLKEHNIHHQRRRLPHTPLTYIMTVSSVDLSSYC